MIRGTQARRRGRRLMTKRSSAAPRFTPAELNALGPTGAERMAAGKALRAKVPRTSHAEWKAPSNRREPVDVLAQSDRGRLRRLLPIRYGRMRQSPFAFFRGSA